MTGFVLALLRNGAALRDDVEPGRTATCQTVTNENKAVVALLLRHSPVIRKELLGACLI